MGEFKNSSGHYRFSVEDNIVHAQFFGALNESLITAFAKEILIETESLMMWGYISDSTSVTAATPQAQEMMIKLAPKMKDDGCVATAYLIKSAVARFQLSQIHQTLGYDGNIQRIFDSFTEAHAHVSSVLNQLQLSKTHSG